MPVVAGEDFAQQDRQRPAVHHDVVTGQHTTVPIWCDADQRDPESRLVGQLADRAALGGTLPLDLVIQIDTDINFPESSASRVCSTLISTMPSIPWNTLDSLLVGDTSDRPELQPDGLPSRPSFVSRNASGHIFDKLHPKNKKRMDGWSEDQTDQQDR